MKEVIAGVPLAQYAAVTAALAEAFPLRAVLSIEGLDAARWAEADRGWTARLDEDPALLARYETDFAVASERLYTREDPAPDRSQDEGAAKIPPPRAAKARLTRSGTGLAQLPAMPAPVAFSALVPPPPALAPPPPVPPPPALALAEPRLSPQDPDEAGTLTGFKVPGEFLPFRAPSEVQAGGARPPDFGEPRPFSHGRDDEGTQVAFAVPSEFLPFRAPPPPPPPPPDTAPPPPAVEPDSSDEEGTLTAFKVPDGFLPFRSTPSREFQEALRRPGAAEGEGSDGMTLGIRGAEALRSLEMPWDAPRDGVASGPKPWAPAAPSRVPPPVPPPRRPPPPVPPRKPPSPPSTPGAPPPMSLQRHASLCLEMAVDPAHAGEALARYQVSAAEKARADDYFRARIAADPELGAQWNQAYAVYHAWFTSRSRT